MREDRYEGDEVAVKQSGRPGLDTRLGRIDRGLQDLGEGLDRVETTLHMILGPERPSPALGQVRAEEESDLARALDSFAGRIEAATVRLSTLMDRVDL